MSRFIKGVIFICLAVVSFGAALSTALAAPASVQPCAPAPAGKGNRITFISTRDKKEGIYLANADGTGMTCLVMLYKANAFSPAWAPDGKYIGFILRDTSTPEQGDPLVYVVSADGSDVRALVKSSDFAWSPDGKQIAFSNEADLNIINLDGSQQRNLTHNHAGDYSPAWSPDGKSIAYSQPDGIHLINVDGSNSHNLTNSSGSNLDLYPVWAPNGQLIAFKSKRLGLEQVYVVSIDGKKLYWVSDNQISSFSPVWSPDSQRIAFVTAPSPGSLKNNHIMMVDASGFNLHRLTKNTNSEINPAWSLDGKRLAFEVAIDQRDNHDIYVIDATGANQLNLTNHPAFDGTPLWQP